MQDGGIVMAFCNLDKAFYEGVGTYDFPVVESNFRNVDVKYWLAFDLTRKVKMNIYRQDVGIHFFLHDYQFECLWANPNKYIDNFQKCGAVLMTDFSMFTDFPKAIQIYNKYRNHWLARFYQDRGVNIIPTLLWSDEDSLSYSFEGYEEGGVFAVPEISIIGDEESRNYFLNGIHRAIDVVKPSKLLVFTKSDKKDVFDFGVPTEWISTGFKHKMDTYTEIKEKGFI